MTGFTQSETSTAWCGRNVVVGFNDSGSFLETFDGFTQGTTGLSGNGVAFSSDRGRTFQDIGPLNPGPDPSGFLLGDAVIGCANESTFYYSSLFQSGFSDPVSAISVIEVNGWGRTASFALAFPVSAVSAQVGLKRKWFGTAPVTVGSRVRILQKLAAQETSASSTSS